MQTNKPYIIGETAGNHEGDIKYLLRIIDNIAELKLNAVKFHFLLNIESYFQKNHPMINLVKKWLFNKKQWKEIINYALSKKLDVVALCNDVESIKFIKKFFPNLFAIELHATGLNDYFLLKEALEFKGKIILGIGGSTIDEIEYAVNFLRKNNKEDILLMYGYQSYPTDYNNINMLKMLKIQSLFNLPVGYADHTAYNDKNNEIISAMAAMIGISILEKHYTLDFGIERIDFHSAVGNKQMMKIKQLMELALTVYGTGCLQMSLAETSYGNTGPMKKAIVARINIKKGEKLSLKNLYFKRTQHSTPIKQNMFFKLIGLEANDDIFEDEIIDFSKVKYEFVKQSVEEFTNVKK